MTCGSRAGRHGKNQNMYPYVRWSKHDIPSGYVKIAIENHHAINGKIHYFYGPFSIAILT